MAGATAGGQLVTTTAKTRAMQRATAATAIFLVVN